MRVKTKGFIKPLALGGSKGFEFARGGQGVGKSIGFISLVKQNKKGKNCAVFCFAGKRKIFFIYL